MSVNKELINVTFTKGINQKLDDKVTLSADLLKCENRIFTKQGSLEKRNGYTTITNKDCDGNTLTDLKSISKFRETQLVMVADNKLYSYSDSNDIWVNKDNFISVSAGLDTVVRNSAEQSNMDSAIANGFSSIRCRAYS